MISYFLKQNREGPKEFADLKKKKHLHSQPVLHPKHRTNEDPEIQSPPQNLILAA